MTLLNYDYTMTLLTITVLTMTRRALHPCSGGRLYSLELYLLSPGALFTPAVVDGVRPGMRLFTEEQFGPVVPIARYADVAEVAVVVETSVETWP